MYRFELTIVYWAGMHVPNQRGGGASTLCFGLFLGIFCWGRSSCISEFHAAHARTKMRRHFVAMV